MSADWEWGMLTAEEAAALHAQSFAQIWDAPTFALLFSAVRTQGIACRKQGALIGMIVLRAAGETADILTLAVVPAWRRQGIAAALLAEGEKRMRAEHVERMLLEVSVKNAGALALYNQHGYGEIHRRPKYYHLPDGSLEDAVIMEKLL